MKKLSLLLLPLALFSAELLTAQTFKVSPEHPKAGEKVRITYNPAGTALEGGVKIEAVLFQFGVGDMPVAKDLELALEGDSYTGEVLPDAGTKAAFVSLSAGEKRDDNGGEGYRFMLYNADRKEPVPGAYGQLGLAYGTWSRMMGLGANPARGMEYLKKEFAANPAARKEKSYFQGYAQAAKQTNDEAALNDVRAQIKSLTANRKATEADWMMAYNANRVLDEDQAETMKESLLKKYPKGQQARQELVMKFYNAKETAEREELFQQYKKIATADKADKSTMGQMASVLASSYGEKDWAKFDQYAALVTDKAQLANAYNNIAWKLAGEGFDGEAKELERAEKLSRLSLEHLDAVMSDISNKPSYMTERQWKENLNYSRANNADTYALVLYRLGKHEKALENQQAYIDLFKYSNGEANERYTLYLEKVKGAGPALELLEELIRTNKATGRMKDQYKQLFASTYTLEQAAGKQLASLEKEAVEESKKELKAKMMDESAPLFTLRDLNGNEVSLAGLKGKTVVVDFWATWCGPCVASFPGMQMAVNKFKDDPNVVFLFVDTWESAKDKKQNASDFISKKGYTFQVLLDEDNKVIGDYKVEGIPTKFILDGNGRIRFKSVGFDGNADKLVTELSLMIGLAAEAAAKGKAVSMNDRP